MSKQKFKVIGYLSEEKKIYKTSAAVKAQATKKANKEAKLQELIDKRDKLRQNVEDELRAIDRAIEKEERSKKETSPIEQMETSTLIEKINHLNKLLD